MTQTRKRLPASSGSGVKRHQQQPTSAVKRSAKTQGESLQHRTGGGPGVPPALSTATGHQRPMKGLSSLEKKNLVTFVTKNLKVAEESSEKITSILHASLSAEEDKEPKRKETSRPTTGATTPTTDSALGKLSITPVKVKRGTGSTEQSPSLRYRGNLFAKISKQTAHNAARMGYFKPNRYTTEESLKSMTDEQLLKSRKRDSIERICLTVAIFLSFIFFYLALHFKVINPAEPPKIYRLKSRIPTVTVPPGYD